VVEPIIDAGIGNSSSTKPPESSPTVFPFGSVYPLPGIAPVLERQDVAVELDDEEMSVQVVPLFVESSTQKLS
jgi:hypothetical protein